MRTLLLAFLLPAMVADAQEYDPSIPTPDSVLGYPLGAQVTDYAGMERYLSTLAKASPRVVYGAYGSDYENRALRYLVVSSEENIERLDDIKSANIRLTDPRKLSAGDASSLIEKTPVTVWLNYSADGNETAGLESALMMAYHLASATDGETKRLLEGVVVILTPLMNPSSHERWASWSNSFAAGPAGNPDPLAMEHNPPWGILTNNNHYLVDLNRESIWATQKESAALRDFYYEWNPMVFIDLHGEYDNFVGPGYEEPLNPLYTEAQRQWFGRFGKAIGKTFAGLGWSYSAWETGSFYPGFWESFGALNGAIGFTYETIGGGSKGLRYRRDDGSIITLKLGAEQHFQASLAVIETSVGARKELMEDFAAFWRSARAAEEQAFLIEHGSDPARADLLIETLLANRVEVFKSTKELSLTNVHDYFGRHWNERSFPDGVYVVPVAQPQARLVLTMLRKDFELPKVTRDAAREFRRNQEKAGFHNPNIGATGYIFYDVTAWSMPLTFDVSAYWTEAPVVGDLARIDAVDRKSPPRPPESPYGYVFRGQSNASMTLLIDLIQRGVVTNVAYRDFRIQGEDYSRGSVVIRKERNPDVDLKKLLGAASERHGVRIDALDSNYSEVGPSLGSDQFVFVKRPRIAVLAGNPVSVRSFGNTWFILEQLYRLTFTAVYKEQLNEDTLDEYNVLVLPDGNYDDPTFSEQWIAALGGWIRRGGTLVCFKSASAWLSSLDPGLTSARMREPIWPLKATESIKPRRTAAIPGAILRTVPDEHHYLSMGYDGPTPVLVHSNFAFESDPSLAAPFTFSSSARNLVLSGFAYGDSVERLASTPYVIEERVGSGHVILFLDDPTFRVYWHGLARLFLNSILLSPSF